MAWLPAGPTASEAAEIILFLLLPFLQSLPLNVHAFASLTELVACVVRTLS